jgi:Protein of unknown function (DUF4232)
MRFLALAVAASGLALAGCGTLGSSSTASTGNSPSGTPSSTPSSTAGATPASSAASSDACTTTQLKVTVTHTGALGGQAGAYLRFTNDGSATCQLNGWPTVVALTAAGQATTLEHAQSTMYGAWHVPTPLPVVKLQPGASAYAVVASDDQPVGSATSCPAPYVRLRVSPPGSPAAVTVSAWLPGARSYLPACTAVNGAPTGEISAITSLASLPH